MITTNIAAAHATTLFGLAVEANHFLLRAARQLIPFIAIWISIVGVFGMIVLFNAHRASRIQSRRTYTEVVTKAYEGEYAA